LTDALGSLRAVNDDTGTVIGAADWDAWGNAVSASGAQSGVEWAGELRDPATGLTYLRARDYSPGTGRFTSRDNLSPNGSGTLAYEPYAYANLNPATFGDPTGHTASPWARCVICTPLLASVALAFQEQQIALAATAPIELAGGPIRANRWALAGFALVAAIFTCIVTPACHEVVPRVVEETDAIGTGAAEEAAELARDVAEFLRQVKEPSPKPEPKPKARPDPIPPQLPDPKPDRKDRNCKPRPFTRDYFRENLACHTGENPPEGPPGDDAHHIFPWQFQVEFAGIFKNPFEIHGPANGAWWELRDHRYVRRAPYNNRWRGFLLAFPGRLPPEMDTRAFGVQIMQEFSPIPRAAGVH
jgi:RHS repeat-associated protein